MLDRSFLFGRRRRNYLLPLPPLFSRSLSSFFTLRSPPHPRLYLGLRPSTVYLPRFFSLLLFRRRLLLLLTNILFCLNHLLASSLTLSFTLFILLAYLFTTFYPVLSAQYSTPVTADTRLWSAIDDAFLSHAYDFLMQQDRFRGYCRSRYCCCCWCCSCCFYLHGDCSRSCYSSRPVIDACY